MKHIQPGEVVALRTPMSRFAPMVVKSIGTALLSANYMDVWFNKDEGLLRNLNSDYMWDQNYSNMQQNRHNRDFISYVDIMVYLSDYSNQDKPTSLRGFSKNQLMEFIYNRMDCFSLQEIFDLAAKTAFDHSITTGRKGLAAREIFNIWLKKNKELDICGSIVETGIDETEMIAIVSDIVEVAAKKSAAMGSGTYTFSDRCIGNVKNALYEEVKDIYRRKKTVNLNKVKPINQPNQPEKEKTMTQKLFKVTISPEKLDKDGKVKTPAVYAYGTKMATDSTGRIILEMKSLPEKSPLNRIQDFDPKDVEEVRPWTFQAKRMDTSDRGSVYSFVGPKNCVKKDELLMCGRGGMYQVVALDTNCTQAKSFTGRRVATEAFTTKIDDIDA